MDGAMCAVLQGAAIEPGYDFLAQRRLAPEPTTTGYISRAAHFLRRHRAAIGHGRWAAVAAGAASYGMVRMAQGMAGVPVIIHVFTDFDEAHRCLRC
jgi:hypothetical protein